MSEFSVRKPVTIFMICLGLIVLGIISANRIQLQLLPEFETPEFSIVTRFKGATPEEVERLVSAPIERAISTVSGLYFTESYSSSELSEIKIKFRSNIDYLETLSVIRDQLQSADLPEGTSRPKILRFSSNNDPIIRLALVNKKSSQDQIEFSHFIKELLVRKIESIDGVALASVIGTPKKIVEITLNLEALKSFKIPLNSIPSIIKEKNKTFGGGQIEYLGKRVGVRLGESIKSTKDLEGLVIKKVDNKSIRLQDIANIKTKTIKSDIRTHLQAGDSLVLEVQKEAEANTVQVADKALQIIHTFLEQNKQELEGVILVNQGKEIKASVNSVIDAVISGGFLAALVIFIFLQSPGPTAIVALSIPMSLMLTLIMMYFTGVSFNLMSLGGLALGVGMLVDNSIVVLENINKLKSKMDDPKEAAIWGTKKVSGAIIASTMTTIAVFGPLIFVEGMIGQMFKDISLTVVYSLLSSLFVSVMIIPMLSSFGLSNENRPEPKGSLYLRMRQLRQDLGTTSKFYLYPLFILKKYSLYFLFIINSMFSALTFIITFFIQILFKMINFLFQLLIEPIFKIVSRVINSLQKIYAKYLEVFLIYKKRTLSFIALSFIGSIMIFANLGSELFPQDGVTRLVYQLEFPAGQVLALTEKYMINIEQKLKEIDGVNHVVSLSGKKGSNSSELIIMITPTLLQHIQDMTKKILTTIPELKFDRKIESMTGGGKPLVVEIYNEDLKALKEQTQMALGQLQELSSITDIDSDLKSDIPQISIEFIRDKLNQYQTSAGAFSTPLKNMLMSQSAGVLQFSGEDFSTFVTVPQKYFDKIEKLKYLSIDKAEQRLYLDQVSQLNENKVLGLIRRINRKRVMSISANLNGADLKTASEQVKQSLSTVFQGKEIDWRIGGQDAARKESEKSLMLTVLLSIFLIYLLLASQFESLRQPIIILMAVPLCIVGVALLLLVIGMNISALVFVGFIILAGISVNTSIVLVDTINQLRVTGMEIKTAIIQASSNRLRPILMTALTTIIGLLPMALAVGQGGGMRKPLAITVIGGLISSTVLTLIVVPLIYEFFTKDSNIEFE